MDGKAISEKITVPAAASGEENYDDYNKVEFDVNLTQGKHILRFTVTGAWLDIDYMNFVVKGEPDPEPIIKSSSSIEPESSSSENPLYLNKNIEYSTLHHFDVFDVKIGRAHV